MERGSIATSVHSAGKTLVMASLILFAGQLLSGSALAACKGNTKTACSTDTTCSWVESHTRKDGARVKAHCRTKPGKRKATTSRSSSTTKKKVVVSKDSKSTSAKKTTTSKAKSTSSSKKSTSSKTQADKKKTSTKKAPAKTTPKKKAPKKK